LFRNRQGGAASVTVEADHVEPSREGPSFHIFRQIAELGILTFSNNHVYYIFLGGGISGDFLGRAPVNHE
jgi:hypothetical protein